MKERDARSEGGRRGELDPRLDRTTAAAHVRVPLSPGQHADLLRRTEWRVPSPCLLPRNRSSYGAQVTSLGVELVGPAVELTRHDSAGSSPTPPTLRRPSSTLRLPSWPAPTSSGPHLTRLVLPGPHNPAPLCASSARAGPVSRTKQARRPHLSRTSNHRHTPPASQSIQHLKSLDPRDLPASSCSRSYLSLLPHGPVLPFSAAAAQSVWRPRAI